MVSGTEVVQPPGSSVGSEVIEEEIDIDFDETLPENQQTLLENQSNIDILNSVGFFDSNKPQMENIDIHEGFGWRILSNQRSRNR